MKKELKEMLLEEMLKDFRGPGRINSGSYSTNLYTGENFETRFKKELEKELEKDEDNYPLIERISNAYNNSLL